MHIWKLENWIDVLDYNNVTLRTGLRLRFDRGIDPFLCKECKEFVRWLRSEYYFPLRVPIYFKNSEKLRCADGSTAPAAFFMPFSYADEPYIRVAVGDFRELCQQWGKIDALFAVLISIAHELTHYFQWINGLQLTAIGEERQATVYAKRIVLEEYQDIWEERHAELVNQWLKEHTIEDNGE